MELHTHRYNRTQYNSFNFVIIFLPLLFFLGCVAVAGIYGALTAEKNIFYIQAAPALLAMVLILL